MLVSNCQRFAFSLALRLVGNRTDAEDILQEVFIRVWKHLPSYRKEVKFTTWLYTIVTNRCLDHLKSRHRKNARLYDGWEDHPGLTDHETTDQQLLHEEFRAVVSAMAEVLTPKQRAVFVLRDLEELPVEEVCIILSMSAGNVKSNLYHARVRMSELIKRYYAEYKIESR